MLWDSWRLWFSRRPRELSPRPRPFVAAALAPCICRRPCTILAALVAAFSSRCRRPCPLLAALAALAAFAAAFSPVCRRRPRGLSTRRPCSYTSRPHTVCLSPSATRFASQISDLSTVRFPRGEFRSDTTLLSGSSPCRRVRGDLPPIAKCDSLVIPFLPSAPNDIDNRDQYRIYTRNGYEESTTAV